MATWSGAVFTSAKTDVNITYISPSYDCAVVNPAVPYIILSL